GLDADAKPRDFVGMGAGYILAPEQHLAMARLQLSREHLEERAFAGPVRPDQAAQFAFRQGEVDVAHGLHAAEMHAEIAGLQQRLGHQPSSARFGFSASAARRIGQRSSRAAHSPSVGTNPFGTSSTK